MMFYIVSAAAAAGGAAYLAFKRWGAELHESLPSAAAVIPPAILAPSFTLGPLSRRRQAALAFISDVIPSKYPDDKFMAIVGANYKPDDPSLPPGYTTCAALPCYVGRMLGVTKPVRTDPKASGYCITQGGLASLITNAKAADAWVVPDGTNRPLPGDFYAQGAEAAPAHVGVFIKRQDIGEAQRDAESALAAAKGKWPVYLAQRQVDKVKDWIAKGFKEVWTTADTGQGDKMTQEGQYVTRPYDPVTNTTLGLSGRRTVTGWYDLDKAPGVTL